MSEKIKVNVTQRTLSIIEKDAESFEFFKGNGTELNKNALLTNLIVNYYETYQAKLTELYDYFKSAISSEFFTKPNTVSALSYKLAGHLSKLEAAPNKEKFDCTLSIKPTKQSAAVIDYIEEYLLAGFSLSEYFRNMISSYAALPRDEREKIIFREQYSAITQAIKDKKALFIKSKSGASYEAHPHAITTSKEEIHQYLLATVKGVCTPIRLSRIVSATVLQSPAKFSDEQLRIFERMFKYGPQFNYGKDDEEVLVRLTPKGEDMFKRIYIYRPVPDKVIGDCYYFNCSYGQLIQYFTRFGKHAYIVYPQKLRFEIMEFHEAALKAYTKK